MAMHLGNNDADDDIISTINTTPLVDVMLVLLIIFLITIPCGHHFGQGRFAPRNQCGARNQT